MKEVKEGRKGKGEKEGRKGTSYRADKGINVHTLKEGREEGRKEVRKEGRKGGRKKGG